MSVVLPDCLDPTNNKKVSNPCAATFTGAEPVIRREQDGQRRANIERVSVASPPVAKHGCGRRCHHQHQSARSAIAAKIDGATCRTRARNATD